MQTTSRPKTGGPLFPLGCTLATPGALETLLRTGFDGRKLLARHVSGDWGNLDREDWAANDRAILEDTRIFSSYTLGDMGERVWIITEADRSATTIMRPDEY